MRDAASLPLARDVRGRGSAQLVFSRLPKSLRKELDSEALQRPTARSTLNLKATHSHTTCRVALPGTHPTAEARQPRAAGRRSPKRLSGLSGGVALRVLRRLGGPCERGGVVNTSDSDDTHNAPGSVIAQREQPDARRDCLVSTTGPGRTLPLSCAGAELNIRSRVEEGRGRSSRGRKHDQGRVGRPVRSAIYVAKDAKSAH